MSAFEPYSVIVILIVTMALFIWGKWRYDVVALIALVVAVAIGAVPFTGIYSGLNNPAVVSVACVMVISQAITRSGLLDRFVRFLARYTKSRYLHILSLITITAVLSAFMNNTGALALMLPITISTATKNKRSPSLLLMPIALASALGGLCTVIGTPPNLLISNYRQQFSGQAFAMFDFAHVGFFVALAGIIFIATIGWRLIPRKRKASAQAEDLIQTGVYVTEIKVTENSRFVDKTVGDIERKIKSDFIIVGLIRNNRKKFVLYASHSIHANDVLIIECPPDAINEILEEGKFELVTSEEGTASDILKSEDVGTVEAVVPHNTNLSGESARSLRLRSRHQVNLLAIARQGSAIRQRIMDAKFAVGDVVLLQGATNSLQETAAKLGFLPLVSRSLNIGKQPRAYLPLVIFILAILATALQLMPVEAAFGGAAVAMVIFNVMSIQRVYESIEWSIIILLAAMIPIGIALQTTGGTALITHYFIAVSGHISPVLILFLLLIVTMTLSDFMNNAATTIVMAPIAVSIAQALKVNIDPFLMTVAIGASCSFLTPVGHQNNALVMGPGGYKFTDYIRVGLPLEIVIVIVSIPCILWAWPLR